MHPGSRSVIAALLAACSLAAATNARAHCDTLSGPVVSAAKAALERRDVAPLLKWVKESEEAELRKAFDHTLAVRGLNAQARELADRFLFETAVRLHRLGEGEPYTGLKADEPDRAIELADKALASGTVDELVKALTDHVSRSVRDRFAVASERRRHADDNVAAGRAYVAAYVEFMHYLEQLHAASAGGAHESHR